MSGLNLIESFFSMGRRIVAVAFIVMILVANVWFIQRMTDGEIPEWSYIVFFLSLVVVLLGFLMMVPAWLNPPTKQSDLDENSK